MVFGGFRSIRSNGEVRLLMPTPGGHTFSKLLQSNPIGTTSVVMCRRDPLVAIGKDYVAAVKAHGLFYEKFRADFADDRVAHHAFVYKYGELALRAGAIRDARALLWRAWRLDPRNMRALGLVMVASRPALDAYRWVRRLTGHYQPRPDPAADPAEG